MQIETCEICGKTFVAGYGYSIAVSWLVTGSAYVPAFMCPEAKGSQHWGCTPEHALEAMQKCLQEHMSKDKLLEKHEKAHKIPTYPPDIENGVPAYTIRPRYSEEDESWAKDKGDNFHLVEVKL